MNFSLFATVKKCVDGFGDFVSGVLYTRRMLVCYADTFFVCMCLLGLYATRFDCLYSCGKIVKAPSTLL